MLYCLPSHRALTLLSHGAFPLSFVSEVLKRLVAHSNTCRKRLQDRFPGLDPSFNGRGDGFRNATIRDGLETQPIVMRGDRLDQARCCVCMLFRGGCLLAVRLQMLQYGVLEFDFVSYERPSSRAHPVTAHTFRRVRPDWLVAAPASLC